MTGVISYILTYDRMPELDNQLRPKMFYSQRVHDKCYRRAHFDAGQFVERWDDEGARQGWCLYKMGCRGPTTYNACASMGWNERHQLPDQVGPWLHRLFGRRLLGSRAVLRAPARHAPVGRRVECRQGGGDRRGGARRAPSPPRSGATLVQAHLDKTSASPKSRRSTRNKQE